MYSNVVFSYFFPFSLSVVLKHDIYSLTITIMIYINFLLLLLQIMSVYNEECYLSEASTPLMLAAMKLVADSRS